MASVLAAISVSFVPTSSAAPPPPAPPLSLRVAGNHLVDGAGNRVQLRGVNRSGTEYACVQGWGIFDGASDEASVAAIAAWHVNAVRIPMNEDCWLAINGINPAYAGTNYQHAIINYVNLLNQHGIYAILDLATVGLSTAPSSVQSPMPDEESATFWSSVATSFKHNPAVLFDLYNEPFPDNNTDTPAAWTCWRDGGTCAGLSYQAAGMQQLVDTVRAAGATNVITIPGIGYASVLDQWGAYEPTDPAGQLVADFHNYSFGGCTTAACWNTIPGQLHGAPLLTGEMGFDGYVETYMNWADTHAVSYLAWTWDTWGCGGGQALISDYNGTPCNPYGTGYQTHLAAVASVLSFRLVPGAATDIGVGSDGSVWVVGTKPVAGGGDEIYHWTGSRWAAVPGGAVSIAVDPRGNAWVVSAAHLTRHWNGTAWVTYPDTANDVAVGANGSVWTVGTNRVAGGYGIYRWAGRAWAPVPGGAVRIAVDPRGNAWVVSPTHHIYHWNGTAWASYPGAANDVAVGANGSVWALGLNRVAGGYGIYRWTGTAWAPVPGGAVRIAVASNGHPWLITSAHEILGS
jgi:hypothetical protein